ncbi:MAG: type II toxin-antitoxin system RelE/ParE family toxin [Deltaproteobacteria bacterium]|nr:type II toxin-antitoxin system RelE/ParE family toxin [Deltaproteobacteria bacterium]
MNQLIVRAAAEQDVRAIREWYEGEEEGLGAQFLAELDAVVDRLRRIPGQFPEVRKGLRRALLRRFPYCVYFLNPDGSLIVLAVLHQHRSPREWKNRAKSDVAG